MERFIMEKLHCSEKKSILIAGQLEDLSPELKPLLEQWLSGCDVTDDTLYHGYSLNMIMKKYGMKFTGALLTLDSLLKKPDKTLKVLSEPVR